MPEQSTVGCLPYALYVRLATHHKCDIAHEAGLEPVIFRVENSTALIYPNLDVSSSPSVLPQTLAEDTRLS